MTEKGDQLMGNFVFNEDKLTVLFTEDDIQKRVKELGAQITQDYKNTDLTLISILKGGFMFLSDLCKHIKTPLSIEFMGVRSYLGRSESSGIVQITHDLTQPIEDKEILIVEDIIDTGLTMAYLFDVLRIKRPRSIKVCSLLHKPARTRVSVPINYLGFTIPDKFVVGYGLDYNEKYRNLPYISYIEDEPAYL